MNENIIICESCGAKCDKNDVYCKSCSQPIANSVKSYEPVICGIDNIELREFIGKNSDYYFKKFTKAKGKDKFIQLNVPALLFGPYWFFYRRMYKMAIIYAVITLVLSTFLSVALPTIFSSAVDNFRTAEAEYTGYDLSGVKYFEEETGEYIGPPEDYLRLCNNLKAAQNKLKVIDFFTTAPILLFNIVFRLFANYFYKQFIIENIGKNQGGTSSTAAVLGVAVIVGVSVIISILMFFVPTVREFSLALSDYRYYI